MAEVQTGHGQTPAPEHALDRNSLGFLDAIVMAVAGSAPAYSIAATTAAIVAAVGFAAPAALLYCGIPMMGIAIAYHHLNKVGANAGAAYAWVGRVLHPVLGFFSGWALVVSATIFMVAGSLPAGSVTLSLFSNHLANETGWVTAVGAVWFLVMAYFVARGVRLTANAQWIMSGIEVFLLLLFIVLGIVHAGNHAHVSFSWSWLGFSHFTGFGVFVSGALIAAFYYWGWDVASNLNEETENSERSSGIGGIVGVIIVFLLFELFTIVINMDLSSSTIQNNSGDVLSILGQKVWPGIGGKLLIIAVMLSTVATLETTLIQVTRSLFAMSRERTLPRVLGEVHSQWRTPVAATAVVVVVSLSLFVLSNFIGSVGTVLSDAISAIGLQIAIYYGLAGLAAVVAFRRHLFDSVFNFVFMGVFPLVGAVFMFWIFGESIPNLGFTIDAIGLGAMALGFIPLIVYWRRSAYLHETPTLGRIDPDAEPAPGVEPELLIPG
ncbi:MAG TPA: APC family permease [Solirubrobacteraceae bacterium]|nr:APC family permease [Solirubrobacteraceae bacterium]